MSENKPKITLKNISSFIEGNLKQLGDRFNLLPDYKKEQVKYRSTLCEDCYEVGECKYCGCSVPGKWYVDKSCNNGVRFPDMMNEDDWEEYKRDNDINID